MQKPAAGMVIRWGTLVLAAFPLVWLFASEPAFWRPHQVEWIRIFDEAAFVRLRNTLLYSLLMMAASMLFAAPFIALHYHLSGQKRWVLALFSLLPLSFPPFGVAVAWSTWVGLLQGQKGRILWSGGEGAESWLFSIPGAAVVTALALWPVAYFLCAASGGPSRASVEAGRIHLPRGLALRVIWWPSLRPAVVTAAALLLCIGFIQFEAPALLQVDVYPLEIYIRFASLMNEFEGILLALPYALILPLLVWTLHRTLRLPWPGLQQPAQALSSPAWIGGLGLCCIAMMALSAVAPLTGLAWHASGSAQSLADITRQSNTVIRSVSIALGAAALVLIGGLAFSKDDSPRLRSAASWLSLLLFVFPAVVIAAAWLRVRSLSPGTHSAFVSYSAMLLAYLAHYFVLGYAAAVLLWRHFGHREQEALALAPASWWTRIRRVFAPGLWRPSLLPLALIALFVWKDLGIANLMQPPGGETLTIQYYSLLHYGSEPRTAAVGLLLMLTPALLGTVLLVLGLSLQYFRHRRAEA